MYSCSFDCITGSWSGNRYAIIKRLGAGGVGEIYLAADKNGKNCAIKISKDLVSITKEYRNLERFSDICFAPTVYELDDFKKENKLYHYIVMEHIEGCTLGDAALKGDLSLEVKLDIVRLLAMLLKRINDRGYIYTDLKMENIMLDEKNRLVRVIDFGSVTAIGDSVKEYTPMYDRGSWSAGNRKADRSYQVFAVIMLLILLLLGRDMDPERDKLDNILYRLRKLRLPEGLYEAVISCITGRITDCGGLYDSLRNICCSRYKGIRLIPVLNALIIILTVSLLILIRTVFA